MTDEHGPAIAALRARIAELEARLARVEAQTGIAPAPPVARPAAPMPPVAPPPSVAPPPPFVSAPSSSGPPPPLWPQQQGAPLPPPLAGHGASVTTLGLDHAPPDPKAVAAAREAAAEDLESQVGLRWVNRIGAITLILAMLFVFKYAADSGWIGPGLRVALGVLGGLATLGAAEWLWRRSHAVVAQGVAGLGSAMLYLSLYAAYDWYDLLPRILAFGLLGMVAIGTGALALRFSSQALAVLAGLGALLAPPIISTGSSQIWALNGYLLLIAGLSVLLARMKPWPVQTWFIYLGVKLMYWASVFDDGARTPGSPILIFGVAYYALYLFAPSRAIIGLAQVTLTISMVVSNSYDSFDIWSWYLVAPALIGIAVAEWRRDALTGGMALASAFWLALMTLLLKLEEYSPEPQPFSMSAPVVLTALWALFAIWIPWGWLRRENARADIASVLFAANGVATAFCAVLLFKVNQWEHAALVLFALGGIHWALASLPESLAPFARIPSLRTGSQGVGIFLVTWAIPLQFDGVAATGLWALMATALAWASSRERRWWLDAGALVLFGLAWLRYLGVDLTDLFGVSSASTSGAFFGGLLCAAAAFGAAWFWKGRGLAWAPYVAGHVFLLSAFIHLNWELGGTLAGRGDLWLWRSAGLSVLLSVYGAALVAGGIAGRSRPNRLAGLLMLLFVVLKLYLHDIWMLNTVFRILAFGALGSMMLATSFLYSRLKQTVKHLIASEEPGAPPPPSPPGPPPPGGAPPGGASW